MNDSKNKELEKLKQQQLIDSILSRQQIELDALIQATKEKVDRPLEEIEERKKEIIDSKLKEKEREYKEELEVANMLSKFDNTVKKYEDIDGRLEEWNKEEKEEKEARSKEIKKAIQKQARNSKPKSVREKIEAIGRELFRKKHNEEQVKKRHLYEEDKKLKNKTRDKSTSKEKSKNEKKENAKSKKIGCLSLLKKDDIKICTTNEVKLNENGNIQKKPKRDISVLKSKIVSMAYQKNMDFYALSRVKNFLDITIGKISNTSKIGKTKRESFAQALKFSADEEKAKRNAKKNAKNILEKERFA